MDTLEKDHQVSKVLYLPRPPSPLFLNPIQTQPLQHLSHHLFNPQLTHLTQIIPHPLVHHHLNHPKIAHPLIHHHLPKPPYPLIYHHLNCPQIAHPLIYHHLRKAQYPLVHHHLNPVVLMYLLMRVMMIMEYLLNSHLRDLW